MKLSISLRSSPVLVSLALLAGSGVAPIAAHAQSYTLTDLGTLSGGTYSFGYGVNNSGQVTGEADTAGDIQSQAFLSGSNGGPLTDLGTLGGNYSVGYGVNDSGQVAGGADTAGNQLHAFLSGVNGGPLTDLGTFGGTDSASYGVNKSGQVAGYAFTASGAAHAFLSGSNGGPLTDLGTLPGGTTSYGRGVNDSGQVVGEADMASGFHAFLFSGGTLFDLNSLIAPGSGVTLDNAQGISNTGFITGSGVDSSGRDFAFLLTPNSPVPEASTTVSFGLLLMLGVGGIAVARRKQAA